MFFLYTLLNFPDADFPLHSRGHAASLRTHPFHRTSQIFSFANFVFSHDGMSIFPETKKPNYGDDNVGRGCEWSMALHATLFPDFTGERHWLMRARDNRGRRRQGTETTGDGDNGRRTHGHSDKWTNGHIALHAGALVNYCQDEGNTPDRQQLGKKWHVGLERNRDRSARERRSRLLTCGTRARMDGFPTTQLP